MKIDGYHHVALMVQDMAKSLKLYEGLGGKIVHSFGPPERVIHLLDLGGNATLELIPDGKGTDEKDPHFAHIALRTDEPDVAFELALKLGATERSPGRDADLGGVKIRNAFVYGPDKEVIEFFLVK
ncbi:hypothetical protein FACS1894191_6140 [Clostridia bacterium]|nr:hypothetical protein FACS1894191_6140 [Clostridia bacterium]